MVNDDRSLRKHSGVMTAASQPLVSMAKCSIYTVEERYISKIIRLDGMMRECNSRQEFEQRSNENLKCSLYVRISE